MVRMKVAPTANGLLTVADVVRDAARAQLAPDRQDQLAQYFTPIWVAELMASMFEHDVGQRSFHILDPGAGAGTLFTTLAAHSLGRERPPASLRITAFEIDPALRPFLERSAQAVRQACGALGVSCQVSLRLEDFAAWASGDGFGSIFDGRERYDAAVLNPPYRKLSSRSELRGRLDALGIAAPNLYAAFLGLAVHVVRPGGTIVAIVPRSFCNGTYFRRFRRYLLDSATIRRIHLFARRDQAFEEDAVLQENVVLALQRGASRNRFVSLSFNDGVAEDPAWTREAKPDEVVLPDDADIVLRLPSDAWGLRLARSVAKLPGSLRRLGLQVSTGPVVGFRLRGHFASPNGSEDAAPLLHPVNFQNMRVHWPADVNKPQALSISEQTRRVLVPSGWYVVTKRFTTKEEPRRVVASVVDPSFSDARHLGLENHLNYFHQFGRPLERAQALGLATFLNSTWVDSYFRQFSGHTQVNAGDLRRLRYPDGESLTRLGAVLDEPLIGQAADEALRTYCKEMHHMPKANRPQKRIDEALAALRELGLPRAQQNERSALALLALLKMRPADSWASASNPPIGTTPIMEWARTHYGRTYAPNTRETFRRFTLHQFVDAGLIVANPDQPDRPVNSPKYCYQIEPEAFALLRTFGSDQWAQSLARWRERHEALKVKYASADGAVVQCWAPDRANGDRAARSARPPLGRASREPREPADAPRRA